ncbi:MAG: hypothetical protein CFE45_44360, partial [Burkholderiales bacterium PBB5]
RWRSDELDRLYRVAENEMDPVKRAATYIRMNDLIVFDQYVLPLVHRADVDGFAKRLVVPRAYGGSLSLLHHWYRDA